MLLREWYLECCLLLWYWYSKRWSDKLRGGWDLATSGQNSVLISFWKLVILEEYISLAYRLNGKFGEVEILSAIFPHCLDALHQVCIAWHGSGITRRL